MSKLFAFVCILLTLTFPSSASATEKSTINAVKNRLWYLGVGGAMKTEDLNHLPRLVESPEAAQQVTEVPEELLQAMIKLEI